MDQSLLLSRWEEKKISLSVRFNEILDDLFGFVQSEVSVAFEEGCKQNKICSQCLGSVQIPEIKQEYCLEEPVNDMEGTLFQLPQNDVVEQSNVESTSILISESTSPQNTSIIVEPFGIEPTNGPVKFEYHISPDPNELLGDSDDCDCEDCVRSDLDDVGDNEEQLELMTRAEAKRQRIEERKTAGPSSTKKCKNTSADQSGQKKRHKCSWEGCPKSFNIKSALKIHFRIHTREKPFKCAWAGCGMTFTQLGHLNTHTRIHTNERPFRCVWQGCGKTFHSNGDLKIHTRGHTGDRPFVCDWKGCSLAFVNTSSLYTHQRAHTGERPFACDYEGCGARFTQSSNLTRHIRSRIHRQM